MKKNSVAKQSPSVKAEDIKVKFSGIRKELGNKQKAAVLMLSVIGNEKCEREKLKASLSAWDKHIQFWVLIGDLLQRYNLGSTLDDLNENNQNFIENTLKARKLGDEYIDAHLDYLLAPIGMTRKTFFEAYPEAAKDPREITTSMNQEAEKKNLSFRVYRWSEWLALGTETFKLKYLENIQACQEDEKLFKATSNVAKQFVSRHNYDAKNLPQHEAQYLKQSMGLLTEEWMGVAGIAIEQKIYHVFYPSPEPFIYTKMLKKFMKSELTLAEVPNDRDLATWGKITFSENTTGNSPVIVGRRLTDAPENTARPSKPINIFPKATSSRPSSNPSPLLLANSPSDTSDIFKGSPVSSNNSGRTSPELKTQADPARHGFFGQIPIRKSHSDPNSRVSSPPQTSHSKQNKLQADLNSHVGSPPQSNDLETKVLDAAYRNMLNHPTPVEGKKMDQLAYFTRRLIEPANRQLTIWYQSEKRTEPTLRRSNSMPQF